MKIIVAGVEYPVTVSDNGVFSTRVWGELREADTLPRLGAILRTRLSVRVEVPFTVSDRGVIRHGVCTGIGGDGTILAHWADDVLARTELISWHHTTLARLSDRDTATYRDLLATQHVTNAALELFERHHMINLKDEIATAAKAAREDER